MDGAMEKALRRRFPGLTEAGLSQAALGTSVGGLGWRKPSDVALGAALAGAAQALPKVRMMAGLMRRAGLITSDTIMAYWVRQANASVCALIGQGLVIYRGPYRVAGTFYLSLGHLSSMALLVLPLQCAL